MKKISVVEKKEFLIHSIYVLEIEVLDVFSSGEDKIYDNESITSRCFVCNDFIDQDDRIALVRTDKGTKISCSNCIDYVKEHID